MLSSRDEKDFHKEKNQQTMQELLTYSTISSNSPYDQKWMYLYGLRSLVKFLLRVRPLSRPLASNALNKIKKLEANIERL